MFQTICKTVLCPETFVWDGQQCQSIGAILGIKWYGITLNLIPTNPNVPIPVSLLESIPVDDLDMSLNLLQRKNFRKWNASVFYLPPSTQNSSSSSSVESFIVSLSFENRNNRYNFNQVLETVRRAMSIEWQMVIGKNKFGFRVAFHKYYRYAQVSGTSYRNEIFGTVPRSYGEEHVVLLSNAYTHERILDVTKSLIITPRFLCDQILLLPFEYRLGHNYHLYIEETNQTLGEAQFFIVTNKFQERIKVCLESWLPEAAKASLGYSVLFDGHAGILSTVYPLGYICNRMFTSMI